MTQFSGAPLDAARLRTGSATDARPTAVVLPLTPRVYDRPGVTTWTFIWLMVLLKIPIVALFLIVRWAVRQTPETARRAGRRHRPAATPAAPAPPAPAAAAPAHGAARTAIAAPDRRPACAARRLASTACARH